MGNMWYDKLKIEKAVESQYPAVREFYHAMIDAMKGSSYDLGWKKDIYPAPDFLLASIRSGELYIVQDADRIIASMVINHECNDSYRDFQWPAEIQPDEVTVIHTLGVFPAYGGRGIGRQMMQFAIDNARLHKQKVIRLDVLKDNIPAKRLYESMGFRYLHTLPMFYENTGWTEFDLYEYEIKQTDEE